MSDPIDEAYPHELPDQKLTRRSLSHADDIITAKSDARESIANGFNNALQDLPFGEAVDTHPDHVGPDLDKILELQHRDSGVYESESPESLSSEDDDEDLETYIKRQRRTAHGKIVRETQLGLVFRQLCVWGEANDNDYITTVLSPVFHGLNVWPTIRRIISSERDPMQQCILNNINGYVKQGEMMLVLGRPGSGCSTLLRTLSGNIQGYKRIDGDILYGGMPQQMFMKQHKPQVVYNPEDDLHLPMLTVKQTLKFVLECKVSNRGLSRPRDEVIEDLLELVLRTFGIKRCENTIVGNAFIRGVSGGERKRVSIAEQFLLRSAINVWDGSTKGLDASSSLEFTRSLRVCADLLNKTQLVSMYQASDAMLDLFDKVMVLAEGRCIYFGPMHEAKVYFNGLGLDCAPRCSLSDFLTGVTEPAERHVRPGFTNVPLTAEEFERAYLESNIGKRSFAELESYQRRPSAEDEQKAFQAAVAARKTRRSKRMHYSTSYVQQMRALLVREGQLMKGDRKRVIFQFCFTILMAIIVGSVFFQQPLTGTGAFTRGGTCFFALLFNCFTAAAEVSKNVQGRGTLYKHKSWKLFSPGIQYISYVIVDMPISAVTVVVFSCILYWMCGLNPSDAGAHFGIFIFVLLVTSFAFKAMTRFLAACSPTLDIGNFCAGAVIVVATLYSGYMITFPAIHPWFIWLYYLNPVAYGFRALMQNEFVNLNFICEGASLVPNGPGYTPGSGTTCTVAGAKAGQNTVAGMDYLAAAFDYGTYNVWENVGILFAFMVGFWLLAMFATNVLEFGKGGYTTNAYKRPRREKHVSREAMDEEKALESNDHQLNTTPGEGQEKSNIPSGSSLVWRDMSYSVPDKDNADKVLLDNVTGYTQAGHLTALMGTSGAGKTTLMDVVARRKRTGKVTGDVFVDGQPQDDAFKRISGYCLQEDVHPAQSTVREALTFSAMLRQPDKVSKEEKLESVRDILEILELEDIADALIGTLESGTGISLEQRKRLSIGIELIAKPRILFLDEPTSGLDAQASNLIVRLLRNLARKGQSILCTIHQPSATLFQQFDDLILLTRGGTGEFGIWKNSEEARIVEGNADRMIGLTEKNTTSTRSNTGSKSRRRKTKAAENDSFALSTMKQMKLAQNRMFRAYWRMPIYNLGRFIFQIILGLLLGGTYFMLGTSLRDLQSTIFALYATTTVGLMVMNQVQPNFIQQRGVFYRETDSGFYNWRAFAISMFSAEIPYFIVAATIFYVFFYYMIGLNPLPDRNGFFYITYIFQNLFCVSLGQLVSSFVPAIPYASMLNPLVNSMLALFAGVAVPCSSLPRFWVWMYWINPFHYFIEAVFVNNLYQIPVHCAPGELIPINPPNGQSCQSYMQPFLSTNPGYIDTTSGLTCGYCPESYGQDFYTPLSWSYDHRWRNFGILILYWLFNRLIIFINLKYLRF